MRFLFGIAAVVCACTAKPAAQSEAAAPLISDRASAAVRWVPARTAQDLSLFDVPAVVRSPADAAAVVAAPVRARLVQVLVQAGDQVQAGDAIASVRLPELVQAAAMLGTASERVQAHRRWLGELKTQRGLGMVRGAEVFDIEARLADLLATRAQAEAQLRAAGLAPEDAAVLLRDGLWTLRAPMAATVRSTEGIPGSVLEAGAVVAQLVAPRPSRIEVRLLGPLPQDADVQFVMNSGQVVALSSPPTATAVDPADGALLAWYVPKAAAVLPAGARGRLQVAALPGQVVQVPARALLHKSGRAFVIVLREQREQEVAVQVLALNGPIALIRGVVAGTPVAAEADRVALPTEQTQPTTER